MTKFRLLLRLHILICLLLLAACAERPCREVKVDNLPAQFTQMKTESVFVYKSDGTKQCGQGQEITLDAMSRQMRDIKVISMSKLNDGMMRIQLCGAPTGNINVYEIQAKDQKKAKEYGFLEWKKKE